LNFLRLVFAMTVLASHAVTLGGYRGEGVFNHTTLGTVAVYGFFGISGYLIAGSAMRNRSGRYLWQRFLRIFPGFWVCLIITALLIGVIGWVSVPRPHCGLSCYLSLKPGPITYMYRNSLLEIKQLSVAPLDVANGSLWTLFYEFLCYLMLMVLAIVGLLRRRIWAAIVTAGLWSILIVITLTPALEARFSPVQNWAPMNFLRFGTIFLVGAIIFLFRDRIPDSGWIALVCAGLFMASLWLPTGGKVPEFHLTPSGLLAPLVAYPVLWLGIHLPFHKVGARNDYSYGFYIYAFPISQLLAIWGAYRLGYPIYTLLCILMTVPFAVASWWFVEKRALSLKKLDPKVVTNRVLGAKREMTPGPEPEDSAST